jgi:T5SS/PEP-CTERM-associated repeat protein
MALHTRRRSFRAQVLIAITAAVWATSVASAADLPSYVEAQSWTKNPFVSSSSGQIGYGMASTTSSLSPTMYASGTTHFGSFAGQAASNMVSPLDGLPVYNGSLFSGINFDSLTIVPADSSFLGQAGTFKMRYQLAATMTGTAQGSADGGAQLLLSTHVLGSPEQYDNVAVNQTVTPSTTYYQTQQQRGPSGDINWHDIPDPMPSGVYVTGDMPFIFGQPFNLRVTAYGLAGANGRGSASSSINILVNVDGFDAHAVYNSGGSAVPFYLKSNSGTDWSDLSLRIWTNATGDDQFDTAANWPDGAPPTSTQGLRLTKSGAYNVNNVSGSNSRLISDAGDATLFATTYNLTSTTDDSLVIGRINAATLRVATGEVNSIRTVVGDGAAGSLYISGGTSELDTDTLYVGRSANASLYITNGGVVNVASAPAPLAASSRSPITRLAPATPKTVIIADTPNSIVTGEVKDTGSLFNADTMIIGKGGTGSVTVSANGLVKANDLFVASDVGSVGRLTVSSGGTVQAKNASFGIAGGGDARVVLDGGTVTVDENLGVAGSLTLQRQSNSVLTVRNTLSIAAQGKLSGTGTLTAGTLNNSGKLSPGDENTGKLTVVGDVVQTMSGALDIRINDNVATGNFDSISVTGNASFSGRLNVTLGKSADGSDFRPPNNQNYPVVTTGAMLSGRPDNFAGNSLEAKFKDGKTAGIFKVSQDDHQLQLTKFHRIHLLSVGIDSYDTDPNNDIEDGSLDLPGGAGALAVYNAAAKVPGVVDLNPLSSLQLRRSDQDGNDVALAEKITRAVEGDNPRVRPGDTFIFVINTHGTFDRTHGPAEDPINREELKFGRAVPSPIQSTCPSEIWLSPTTSVTPSDFKSYFIGDKWKDVNKLFIMDFCWSGGFWHGAGSDPRVAYLSDLPRSAFIGVEENTLSWASPENGGWLAQSFANVISNLDGADITFEMLKARVQVAQDRLFPMNHGFAEGVVEDGWGVESVDFVSNTIFAASTPDFELGMIGPETVPEPNVVALVFVPLLLTRRQARKRKGEGATKRSAN